MDRKQLLRYRAGVVVLLAIIISILAGFAIASAGVDNPDGTANSCYSNRNGRLRAALTPCRSTETPVTINRSVPVYARVRANATIITQQHVTTVAKGSTGSYLVTFDRDVSGCAYSVTTDNINGITRETLAVSIAEFVGPTLPAIRQVGVSLAASNGAPVDDGFSLIVTC